MGFSDSPTSTLWVGNMKAGLQQKDIASVFSSFGAIRRLKLGPAPPGTSATGLSAEVHFASVAQAAAALTALNAIVVPRLSGHHPLAIQCWQPSSGVPSHSAAPASAPTKPARPVTAPLVVPRPAAGAATKPAAAASAAPAAPAAAPGPLGPQPDVRPVNLDEAAAAVELPGAEDLQAALAFFEGCSFLAVPEEERGSAVKWAVLQALLSRGLRHLGSCTFRQRPVLLTHLGDELLKHRGSNPAVEAEYQSYPAAGRLTSLLRDIRFPGLVRVHNDGTNTNTVQLHLGRLALAGGAPGGTAGGSAAGSGSGCSSSATPPPKQRPSRAAGAAPSPQSKPPPPNQYMTSSVPSRHLVLLGVAQRADAAALIDTARQHGLVQGYLHNPRKASLVLHFDSTEEALNMAREVEGQTLPGLSGSSPLQVAYKHPVPAGTTAAGTAGTAAQPKASQAKQATQPGAAKAGKGKGEAPVMWQYSATVPSCIVRVKKLDADSATRQGLAQVGQSAGGQAFSGCTFYPSTCIGYLFFKTEEAASAAAAVLRGKDLPWSQGEELMVEFRQPSDSAVSAAAGPKPAAAGGGKRGAAAAAAAKAEEAPPCCACCGASGEGVALSRCSGCRVVHYCGRDCQLKDWAPRHASECAQLQQLSAALQAAQPAAAGPQAQLLVAALRSPGGRKAAMLRSLLGADAVPGGSEQDGSDMNGSDAIGNAGNGSASGASSAGEAATAEVEEQRASNGGTAAAEAASAATQASGHEPVAEVAAASEEPVAAAPAEGSSVDGPVVAADGGSTVNEQQQPAVERAAAGSDAAAEEPSEQAMADAAADSEDLAAAEGQEFAVQQAEAAHEQPAEVAADKQGAAGAAATDEHSAAEALATEQAANGPPAKAEQAAGAEAQGQAAEGEEVEEAAAEGQPAPTAEEAGDGVAAEQASD